MARTTRRNFGYFASGAPPSAHLKQTEVLTIAPGKTLTGYAGWTGCRSGNKKTGQPDAKSGRRPANIMRFHFGAVPDAPDFSPDAAWRPLREPSPWAMQLFAIPLGIVACIVVALLWRILTPHREASFNSPGMLVIVLVAIIPIHELLHAAVHPRFGMSASSILGCWPSRGLFYAHYLGELSRGRFIAILLMPLLVISFAPLLACAITDRCPPLFAFTSILNALLACGDIFAVGLLLFQVPAGATVRNKGWRTFWKIYDDKAS